MRLKKLAKYFKQHESTMSGQPKTGSHWSQAHQLKLEQLDKRVLLSVLDFADAVIDEIEPNDTAGQSQPLPFADDVLGVGIQGNIINAGDIDMYSFSALEGSDIEIRMDLTVGTTNQQITSATIGPDSLAYLVANNSVWQQTASGENSAVTQLAAKATIAAAAGVTETELNITDIATLPSGQALLTTSHDNSVILVDTDGAATAVVTASEIQTITGQNAASPIAIATDADGNFYLADETSGGVIKGAILSTGTETDFTISWYTNNSLLTQAVQRDVLEDVSNFITQLEQTTLAQTDGVFVANSLMAGSGAYGPTGDETQVFYTTQLGPNFDGDGSITRIVTNESDPAAASFTQFFSPGADQQNLNPSALVLDTAGGPFNGKMYMGTFGLSLGDDQDGEIYTVQPDGSISEFVITSFVDINGDPAEFDGSAVTGFFDITDMAFSNGGPFGDYLYVLSENIDQNGTAAGGYNSDLWRVDSTGKAQLFVPDIADGVISLAFDTNGDYGSNLFVATFYNGGQIYKVDSSGSSELFFDFSQFSDDLSIADIAFAPTLADQDLPLENRLLLTLDAGENSFLVQVDPDGETYRDWGGGFETGDVSSGDIAFDADGNLMIVQQTPKTITRVDYQNVNQYELTGIEMRTELDGATLKYVPYVSVLATNQPRIIRLADTSDVDDIATQVSPSVLDAGTAGQDGSKNVRFSFDADGDIYVFIQYAGNAQTAPLTNDDFSSFSTLLTADDIETATGLEDVEVNDLLWSADGRLWALASNGTEGDPTPSQLLDDSLVVLANTITSSDTITTEIEAASLLQFQVILTGGELNETMLVHSGQTLERVFERVTAGDYTLTIQSYQQNAGSYETLVSLDGQLENTIIVTNGQTKEIILETGDMLQFSYTGAGRASLAVLQMANGTVFEIDTLTITGGNIASKVSLTNTTNPNELSLDEIVLGGSMGMLEVQGDIAKITGGPNAIGLIRDTNLGTVGNVEANLFTFLSFSADSLGDADLTKKAFDVLRLGDLSIANDITNVVFFENNNSNMYGNIEIGGTMLGSKFYGAGIRNLLVSNNDDLEEGMTACDIHLQDWGWVNNIEIHGDVSNSNLDMGRMLINAKILDGDMIDSQMVTSLYMGNIYVEQDVRSGSFFEVQMTYSLGIRHISSGGDFGASVFATNITSLKVGYDKNGNRRDEAGDYNGSDFSGRVSTVTTLGELNVTGQIIGASASSSLGSIYNIYAEDGIDDGSTFSARFLVLRVMVGYMNGTRTAVINGSADVGGTYNTFYLGRIYYTGDMSDDISIPAAHGPLIDDRPS